MIDQAAVARYHRDGFIVVEEVFSAAEIDAMRTALAAPPSSCDVASPPSPATATASAPSAPSS
ncbi:MAG: hypothetical protein VXY90_06445, partial [Pseudomonadota bacterium]|nr:hypothetical protein [Pseudomonadota bacterium]